MATNPSQALSGPGDPELQVNAAGGTVYINSTTGTMWGRPSKAPYGTDSWRQISSGGSDLTAFAANPQNNPNFSPEVWHNSLGYSPYPYRQIATGGTFGCGSNGGALTNGTTDLNMTSLRVVTATSDCFDLKVVFGNNLTETPGPNAITVKSSIVDKFGNRWPVNFSGSRTASVLPGQILESDRVPITLNKGDTINIYTYVVVTSGNKWPLFFIDGNGGAGGTMNNGDLVDSGTITVANGAYYIPLAVIGNSVSLKAAVALIGDSLTYGYPGFSFNRGYPVVAMGTTLASQMLGIPSETASNYLTSINTQFRKAMLKYCTAALCQLGINDIGGGQTLAQLQQSIIGIWRDSQTRGMPIWQATLTPNSTSTDGWTTVQNQTTAVWNPTRVNFNTWLRAGAPIVSGVAVAVGTASALLAGQIGHPLSGYFEVAYSLEASPNSGIWIPNFTNDGVHAHTQTAIDAAVSGINIGVFTN